MSLLYYFFCGFSIASISLGLYYLLNSKQLSVTAHRIMGLLLIVLGYAIIFNVLFWTKQIPIQLTRTLPVVIACIGPLYYLYQREVLRPYSISRRDLWHVLLPTGLALIANVRYYLLSATDKTEVLADGRISDYVYWPYMHEILFLIVTTVYAIISLIDLWKSADRELHKWAMITSAALSAIVLSYWVYYLLSYQGLITLSQDHMITVCMCLFISVIGYMAYIQPMISAGADLSEAIVLQKYAKSGLSNDRSHDIQSQIVWLLAEEHIYLDSDLSLSSLAEKAGATRNEASQVINQQLNSSFYELINSYRIKEAKRLITSEADMSFKEVAYSAGFGNRTSFYKAFKKHTGLAPSEYKSRI